MNEKKIYHYRLLDSGSYDDPDTVYACIQSPVPLNILGLWQLFRVARNPGEWHDTQAKAFIEWLKVGFPSLMFFEIEDIEISYCNYLNDLGKLPPNDDGTNNEDDDD